MLCGSGQYNLRIADRITVSSTMLCGSGQYDLRIADRITISSTASAQYVLLAESGHYSITGTPSVSDVTGPTHATMIATSGIYALTGRALGFISTTVKGHGKP